MIDNDHKNSFPNFTCSHPQNKLIFNKHQLKSRLLLIVGHYSWSVVTCQDQGSGQHLQVKHLMTKNSHRVSSYRALEFFLSFSSQNLPPHTHTTQRFCTNPKSGPSQIRDPPPPTHVVMPMLLQIREQRQKRNGNKSRKASMQKVNKQLENNK